MSMDLLRDLCAQMKSLQREKEDAEAVVSKINAQLDDLRLRQIPELMDNLGLRTATFEGLGRVQLASDLYASTKAGQKEAAIQWLTDTGYGDMVQESVNASSLKALFRRMIEAGSPIPEDLFSVNPFIRASIVKA